MSLRALSCLQVKRPCLRAIGQQLRTCLAVHDGCWHRGQVGETCMFHLARLEGVGKESIDALARNDSCPAGRPYISRFHAGAASSSVMVSITLFCTCIGHLEWNSILSNGLLIGFLLSFSGRCFWT